jgi:putative spermidine/putrescine transport system ATP-binding protein
VSRPATTSTGSALRLEGVVRSYGDVRAVDGVSLEVAPGEFFTLLGPSGSGKTTTLQLVAGFQMPTAGEIYLDGRRITDLPPFKRGVGVVFQSYALFPHLTVFENIAFPLRIRRVGQREIDRRVQQALELVKLPGYGERRIGQLSGGQQQRVAVARAIVFGPRLLLMDEPLGALDARLRKEMQAEFKGLQDRLGVTVIYVTHDQEEALIMSDRVAVIRAGRLEQVAAPEEMYTRPRTRFVAEFIGDANVITGRVAACEGAQMVISAGRARLVMPRIEAVGTGDAVSLAVRPERIVIGPDPRTPNVLKGVVAETFYMGDQTVVVVETDEGLRLSVKETNAGGETRRQPGASLTLGWSPEHATLLLG